MKSVRFISLFTLLVSMTALAQSNPVPLINQPLVPASVAPGGQGFTLTVNGTGFASGSVVNWNGGTLATSFVSGSQLSATVPASNIATASTALVTVASPAPGGGTSNVDYFPIRKPFNAVSFGESSVPSGTGAQSPVVADLNGDGKLDLVNLDQVGINNAQISVLIGNGDGTFQPPATYQLSAIASQLIVGDFNNDGRLDLAVVANGVALLLGNGDGTFQNPQYFPISGNLVGMAAGDFNGDGNLDLAITANYPTSQVLIVLGNGNGTFQNPVTYDVSSTADGLNVVTADFDGDGSLDLAIAIYGDSDVAILLGNGDGTFQSPLYYMTAEASFALAVADLNGDGKLDLAVQNSTGNGFSAVSILLGNGDGSFQNYHAYFLPTSGAIFIAAADLNGDGILDLTVGGQGINSTDRMFTLLGKGDGTFKTSQYFPGGAGVAVGDFNGDGMIDMISADRSDLAILLQVTAVLSNTFLNFGKVHVGSSAQGKATFTNIGASTVTISKISLGGQAQGIFSETNTCGTTLAPKASCTISLVFTPQQAGKKYTGVVQISDSAVNVTQTILLEGFGD